MSDATYRIIELTGTSTDGVTEAMENGVARATKTLRNVDWIEVAGIRGRQAGPGATSSADRRRETGRGGEANKKSSHGV